MKKIFILSLAIFFGICNVKAQIFQVDTLQYIGDINKYINLVILGDGYISSEQDKFILDAKNLSSYLLAEAPWVNYKGYFNVFAIKVISNQSGAKHPNTSSDCSKASPLVPIANPNNYLGSTFDSYSIHRLVVSQNTANIVSVLANNFPKYDQIFIIVNSPYYGGAGGAFAVSTVHASSKEITAHEIGHSFAQLGDEYYAGDSYASERANMTKEKDSSLAKWKNWNGHSGIGSYKHCCGGNSAQWYKPHNGCKMQYLDKPYCGVCSQAIVESIHELVNPIVRYSPMSSIINSPNQIIDFKLIEIMKPVPNTLNIKWKMDTTVISNNIDSIQVDPDSLMNGTHVLEVSLTDTTSLLRVDNHSTLHINTVAWTINKNTTGTQITNSENKITFSIYPNPSINVLNVSIESSQKAMVSIQILSLQGKIIEQVTNETLVNGKFKCTFDIEELSPATYSVVLKLGNAIYTQTFIKY